MKKIVSVIKPFVINQNVFVYEDGNKIDVLFSPLEEIQNLIVNTATQYEITDVELIGSKKYLNGIANKIKEVELTKYNENKLNINIISG